MKYLDQPTEIPICPRKPWHGPKDRFTWSGYRRAYSSPVEPTWGLFSRQWMARGAEKWRRGPSRFKSEGVEVGESDRLHSLRRIAP